MNDVVHVAVGVIYREDKIFLTRRHKEAHQGGKWEFPGGKVESQESVAQALLRELKEEVAIDVLACLPLTVVEHDYGDKKVKLEVFLVDNFVGEPIAQEGQEQQWVDISTLTDLNFPEANQPIIASVFQHFSIV